MDIDPYHEYNLSNPSILFPLVSYVSYCFETKIAKVARSSRFFDLSRLRDPSVFIGFCRNTTRDFLTFLKSLYLLYHLVRIAVSPQIAPISFGEKPVNAGDLVSVQCVVTKGDFPLEITWTFDGRPIQSYHGDVIVSDTGKRVKQLIIESVAARHAGEYTCVASNAAGSVSHSAILDVNGEHLSTSLSPRFAFAVFSNLSFQLIPCYHLRFIYPSDISHDISLKASFPFYVFIPRYFSFSFFAFHISS